MMSSEGDKPESHAVHGHELTIALERFEQAWQRSKLPDIRNFLPSADSVNDQYRRRVLTELIMVDLEYRWRNAENSATHQIDKSSGKVLGDSTQLPERPLLDDYLRLSPDLLSASQFPLELIVEEYRIRQQWDNAPNVKDYHRRFPHLKQQLDQVLRGITDKSTTNIVKVYYRSQYEYAVNLLTQLEIGRQREGEPLPYCLVDSDAGMRLIIAPRNYTKLSRRHLQIEHHSDQQVTVASLTTKGDILINSHHRLHPGKTCKVGMPSLLTLGEYVIRLQSNEQ